MMLRARWYLYWSQWVHYRIGHPQWYAFLHWNLLRASQLHRIWLWWYGKPMVDWRLGMTLRMNALRHHILSHMGA